jgi:hypothetical protein
MDHRLFISWDSFVWDSPHDVIVLAATTASDRSEDWRWSSGSCSLLQGHTPALGPAPCRKRGCYHREDAETGTETEREREQEMRGMIITNPID